MFLYCQALSSMLGLKLHVRRSVQEKNIMLRFVAAVRKKEEKKSNAFKHCSNPCNYESACQRRNSVKICCCSQKERGKKKNALQSSNPCNCVSMCKKRNSV